MVWRMDNTHAREDPVKENGTQSLSNESDLFRGGSGKNGRNR